jgi:class 3 adenylate cyclase
MRFCGQCGAPLVGGQARLTEAAPSPVPAHPPVPAQSGAFSPARFGVMMGPDLLERFRRAGLEAAGQRRSVTVLFVDISGYTVLSGQLENEDLYTLIQETLSALAQAVYKYDGVVDKFTGDGLM